MRSIVGFLSSAGVARWENYTRSVYQRNQKIHATCNSSKRRNVDDRVLRYMLRYRYRTGAGTMRTLMVVATAAAVLASVPAFAQGYHAVQGYVRQDGTYVAPHYQTNPDSTRMNNWSTQGNTNPFTGQPGTQNPNPGWGNPNASGASIYGGGSSAGSIYGGGRR